MRVKSVYLAVCAGAVFAATLTAVAQPTPPNWAPVSPYPQLSRSGNAWLGVSLERLTRYYRRYYRVPFQYGGVLVRSVYPRSPAAKAGVLQGDVIVRIDGKYMYRPLDVVQHVRSKRSGQRLRVDLYRYGAWKLVTVTLGRARHHGSAPVDPFAGRPPVRRPPATGVVPRTKGRLVRHLLQQIAELKKEVEVLKKKVARLERQLKGRKAKPAPRMSRAGKRGSGTVPPPAPPAP